MTPAITGVRGIAVAAALLSLISVACATPTVPTAPPDARTYANPVDLDYRYNFEQLNKGISYRTGADPVIVPHGDAYYLFLTMADGYWRSANLVDWSFIAPNRWPFDSMVAPAAISDGARLILMRAAFKPEAVLVSRDPAHGQFDFLTRRLPELPNAVPPGWDRGLPAWHAGDAQPTKIPP
ncbi:MAG: coagulation factor 5/8 type domain protein, partial [Rudaea sp.]